MNKIEKIRGTFDLLDDDAQKFLFVISVLTSLSYQYGFNPIFTPIFENTNLFLRSIGEETDVVNKELYTFSDRSNRSISLRPEGTASVLRSLIETKYFSIKQTPLKYFYYGPMFRYERPQAGRQRQFHQFGIEILGTNSYLDAVEVVLFAITFLNSVKITNYELLINNIGGIETRKKWIEELKKYFSKYQNQLTDDSKRRLKTNPLRILDDKVDGTKEFVKKAPKIDQFLNDEEKKYFKNITNLLDKLSIKYTIDSTLVRGLDYYTNFVFEIVSKNKELSGQSTLIGGGKYDELTQELGGPDISCIGLAIGIERIMICLNIENKIIDETVMKPQVCLCCLDENLFDNCKILETKLRNDGLSCISNYNTTKLPRLFKYAKQNRVQVIVIIGEKEFKQNKVIIKNQTTMEQNIVEIKNLSKTILALLKK